MLHHHTPKNSHYSTHMDFKINLHKIKGPKFTNTKMIHSHPQMADFKLSMYDLSHLEKLSWDIFTNKSEDCLYNAWESTVRTISILFNAFHAKHWPFMTPRLWVIIAKLIFQKFFFSDSNSKPFSSRVSFLVLNSIADARTLNKSVILTYPCMHVTTYCMTSCMWSHTYQCILLEFIA